MDAAKIAGVAGPEDPSLGLFECCDEGANSPLCTLLLCPVCVAPCYFATNGVYVSLTAIISILSSYLSPYLLHRLVDGPKKITNWSVNCISYAVASAFCLGWLIASSKRDELK